MYYSYFEDYPKEIRAKALRNVAVTKNDVCVFGKVSCQESELNRNKETDATITQSHQIWMKGLRVSTTLLLLTFYRF